VATIDERLIQVMRDVFDKPGLAYRPDLTGHDVDEWDSISNISFIMALEKEFKISFALVEVQELKNVGEMVQLIAKKTAPAA
jgi:acyl carrier protein